MTRAHQNRSGGLRDFTPSIPAVCFPVCSWVTRRTAKSRAYQDVLNRLWSFRTVLTSPRCVIHASVEAEDLSLDFGPGNGLSDRHQDVTVLCCGSLPLTHASPFHHTGPTSAYPRHYPGLWRLRASSSPVACRWYLLCGVTTSQRAPGGYSVPSFHCSHPEDDAVHRVSRQCSPVNRIGCRCRILCPFDSSVSASCAGVRSR